MLNRLTITSKLAVVGWVQQHSEPCVAILRKILCVFAIFSALVSASVAHTEETAVREIPGITAADRFPSGCVDCHVNMPDRKMDVRIGTLMRKWYNKVDPKVVERTQATVPGGGRGLTGRHPVLPDGSLRDIPASCRSCHRNDATAAPPLGPMLHALHLRGGAENHYIKLFGGECTHCHKLDARTGRWKLPSGPEK